VISIKEIESLASMPSKGELMSKLLFPDQRSGAATDHCDECSRTQSSGRCGSGSAAEEIYG